MDLSQLKQLALPIVLLTLVGCASTPKSPVYVNQPASDLANQVGSAEIGDAISLPANNPLGLDSVVVDRTYFAASGRECRRLRNSNGMPIQRVACKGEDGQWRFARDLAPVSSSSVLKPAAALDSSNAELVIEQTLIPSAGTATSLDSIDAGDDAYAIDLQTDTATDYIQRELFANETLWSFAKRTTGNALNWKVIADTNNITDAKTLAPGAQLNIPVELVSDGG